MSTEDGWMFIEKPKPNLVLVNGKGSECACTVEVSNGHGEYSDVVSIWFCLKHSRGIRSLDAKKPNLPSSDNDSEGWAWLDIHQNKRI